MDLLQLSSKISSAVAVLLTINSFVFSWICFAVPDWLQYTSIGYPVRLGLWSVCIGPISYFSRYDCTPWSQYPTKIPGKKDSTTNALNILFNNVYILFNLRFHSNNPVNDHNRMHIRDVCGSGKYFLDLHTIYFVKYIATYFGTHIIPSM